ncbi:RNA polymerase sigma factor [Candidatus Halocynthiibacter alkanivorans]|uniref:RNA polymerase sigma factor n=1 Tax=Candidatus Halocynthiibacter alkanivorans TaxID=2267619 RepID=UPI000DF3C943|nr:RNA polymerase sigma factor [Candidatus Halocynthiibacter alkanivorans]
MNTDPFQTELQSCLPDLWRYACALCRDRDLADDLVQDCAERALRKRALWRPRGPLKPWLMKMLLNLWRNHCKKHARSAALPAFDPAGDLTLVAPDHLSGALDLGDTARALAQLPEEQREALLTVVLGGLSYKDAARTLGIPAGTLMSRLGRARAALRQAILETPE